MTTGCTRPSSRPAIVAVLLAAVLLLPAAAGAQELYNFTVTALGGIGGSPDSEGDDSLDNGSLQLGFSLVTEPHTQLGLRLGQLDLGSDGSFGALDDADLTYLTVAGEYRFRETYYQSGIYLGLGGYRVEGTSLAGVDDEETAIGLAIGVVGEFEINRRFGIQVELSGHYTDLDENQLFAMGHAGLAVHFR